MSMASSSDAVGRTLDAFHAAAADSDEEAYFKHFAQQGRFLGTDASENWTVAEFRAYAHPAFENKKGWVYTPCERKVDTRDSLAWFDEQLHSEKWGAARGTGVMIQEGESWKILQYHLSFPTPNELAAEITALIANSKSQARG